MRPCVVDGQLVVSSTLVSSSSPTTNLISAAKEARGGTVYSIICGHLTELTADVLGDQIGATMAQNFIGAALDRRDLGTARPKDGDHSHHLGNLEGAECTDLQQQILYAICAAATNQRRGKKLDPRRC